MPQRALSSATELLRGDADHRSTKTTLAVRLNRLIDARGLSQTEAGEILGMPQPKVSAIRNYKLRGISLERLLQALAAFGQQVEIVVRPSTADVPPGVSVTSWHR